MPPKDKGKAGSGDATRILNINVGVLGHVDSGKTSLVRTLSTILSTAALDQNPQSRARGITLDLGFSAFTTELPPHLAAETAGRFDKLQFTLVDCPGHASLIKTIIGGAQIIDLMVLVVDTMKGMQTQTAECLVIGEITTDKLVVVLNKTDLLSPEKREAGIAKATGKIRKALASTRFADCPIVAVSATGGRPSGDAAATGPAAAAETAASGTGAGSDTAKAPAPAASAPPPPPAKSDAADGAAAAPASDGAAPADAAAATASVQPLVDQLLSMVTMPARDTSGPFYFAIDHCFPIRGQGTVMTGTVLNGAVKVGNTVEIPALRTEVKVKSMQMFHTPVQGAKQGDRLGICVAGLDAKSVERGAAATPGSVPALSTVVALVKKVRFFRGSGPSESKFHVTVGHSTVLATAIFFGARELAEAAARGELDLTAPEEEAKGHEGPVDGTTASAGGGDGGGGDAGEAHDDVAAAASAGAMPGSLAHASTRRVPTLAYTPGSEYEWQEELMPVRKQKPKHGAAGAPAAKGASSGSGAGSGAGGKGKAADAKPAKGGAKAAGTRAGGKAGAAAGAAAGADDGGDGSGGAAAGPPVEWQWVCLQFEHPVLCPMGSLVIGSRLDTDIHVNTCRIAFFGRLVCELGDGPEALKGLRLYKPKERTGAVDRVMDDGRTIIGKSLFKKNTDLSIFLGLKLETGTPGVVGTIDSGFGKSGKFKATFMGGTDSIKPGDTLYLRHRKYVYDHSSSMIQ